MFLCWFENIYSARAKVRKARAHNEGAREKGIQMKNSKKRLIACAAISLLSAVRPSATGREIEMPETAVRLVESGMFRARKDRNRFRLQQRAFRNGGRR